MNRTIALILVIALGLYCFPTLIGVVATAFGVAIGIAGTLFGVGVSLMFSVLPYIILAYLVWWLVSDNRRSHHG